jgi:outer membrane immunogenic protein
MNIRASIIAGIALGMACAGQVQAADLGGTPYVSANWSGLYVGGTLSSLYGDVTACYEGACASGTSSDFGGGLLIGYNLQAGNHVFGLEADIDLSTGFDYLSTVRARYGVASGNWLFYGTAGVVMADSGTLSEEGVTFKYKPFGFVVGAGAETKISSHLVSGVEVLYYGFSDEKVDVQYAGDTYRETLSLDALAVRARLSYRFGE